MSQRMYTPMKENKSNMSNPRKSMEVEAQIEIFPSPEYGDSYGTNNVSVQIDQKIYDKLKKGEVNYKVLQHAIFDILENNIEAILVTFMGSGQLKDLEAENYDWWHMEPIIWVLAIGYVDLSSIYYLDDAEKRAAELLDVDLNDIEDWTSDFVTDCRFGIDQNIFRELMQSS